ncbi:DUF2147 domain-containing protein [Mucilaginibacter pallidiroseus]|uniref:DUF2147 domain-containing protein n=2 Tax=Mucilaginibacter pallidiroseus TaxID=2599295 RepID=A0A563U354_9SPHI|nr:DUF2147 domain-containing protein [Mucilaginibacter pallidiroseus]
MMANQLLCSFLALIMYTGINYHTKGGAAADQICGKWESEEKNLIVQVYKDDNEYKARVVWFNNGDGDKVMYTYTDKHNPNPALRNRKVLGMDVVDNLVYSPESQSWENGIIYDASSGRHWNSCARIDKDGKLKVKGYWKFKFIGKSINFKRID